MLPVFNVAKNTTAAEQVINARRWAARIPSTGVEPLLVGLDLSSSSRTEPQHFRVCTMHFTFSLMGSDQKGNL